MSDSAGIVVDLCHLGIVGVEGHKPIGYLIEKREVLEFGKRHHINITTLSLNFRHLAQFLVDTIATKHFFPFRIATLHERLHLKVALRDFIIHFRGKLR